MNNMLLIAKREYLEQIRGRAFRLSTIGVPALFALIVCIGYVASLGLGANKHLVILANDAALADAIRTQLLTGKDATPNVDVVSPADSAAQACGSVMLASCLRLPAGPWLSLQPCPISRAIGPPGRSGRSANS